MLTNKKKIPDTVSKSFGVIPSTGSIGPLSIKQEEMCSRYQTLSENIVVAPNNFERFVLDKL